MSVADIRAAVDAAKSIPDKQPKVAPCAGTFCSPAVAAQIVAHLAPKMDALDSHAADVLTDNPTAAAIALRDEIMSFVADANRATWKHKQLVCVYIIVYRYRPGSALSELDWHCDGNLDPSRDWLGFIAGLSQPGDYIGGELQIGRRGLPLKLGPGQAVVLGGDLEHRVLPVTSGERWSLAAFVAAG